MPALLFCTVMSLRAQSREALCHKHAVRNVCTTLGGLSHSGTVTPACGGQIWLCTSLISGACARRVRPTWGIGEGGRVAFWFVGRTDSWAAHPGEGGGGTPPGVPVGLAQNAWHCASNFAGADKSSPIGAVGVYSSIRKKNISPYPEPACSGAVQDCAVHDVLSVAKLRCHRCEQQDSSLEKWLLP